MNKILLATPSYNPFCRGLLGVSLWLCVMCLFPAPAHSAEKPSAGVVSNSECFVCHGDATLTRTVAGKKVSLEIKAAGFGKSVHSSLSCQDCHPGIREVPHPEKLPPAQCASCHEDACKDYAGSVHGSARAAGKRDAATCADCHGTHYIAPVKQEDSPVYKLNLPLTCARCHLNTSLTATNAPRASQAAAQYMESIHGRALLKLGLIVAPSCSDCHGAHKIQASNAPASPVSHANVAKTCGKCHLGIEKLYLQSVHGQLLLLGKAGGAVCTDCHTAHQIQTAQGGHYRAGSDERCGGCHQEQLKYYRETYHGKAMALDSAHRASGVATCYDCHGYHNVFRTADPRSTLSSSNIVQTCQQCHPGATPSFAQFDPHANAHDGKNYPGLHAVLIFMTCLLLGGFVFFGVHTLFWLLRSLYIYLKNPAAFREMRMKAARDEECYTRFTPFERLLHVMVVTSFLLLVITGMPLKFYYSHWAKVLCDTLGGVQVARALHRLGALITFLYFLLHLAERTVSIWKGRACGRHPETGRWSWKQLWAVFTGPDSMVPCKRDWEEFVAHQKWFFGKGPRPQFERWTYWEKFDYLAVFWGVAMIGLSGLIMWFPVFFTQFMPGWMINIALVIHSDEALLAAGFIFTFHFFNVHFRPEKFPIDTVIFSGRISKTEMMHERHRWYDRLVAAGQLDAHRVRDEWGRWKVIATSFGYIFFGVGLILLALIVAAMLLRLPH